MPTARPRRSSCLIAVLTVLSLTALSAMSCNGGGSDGDLIVYEASELGVSNIFVIDPDGGESRQLTDETSYAGNPSWSPDRQSIIFASDRDRGAKVPDLYVMDPDGGNVRRITDTQDAEFSPRFAPNGDKIAFARRTGKQWSLLLANPDGSDERVIAGPYKLVEFPDWARDGKSIIFSAVGEDGATGADLYRIAIESGEITTVVQTPGADVCPHVTPDGKRLIYATGADDGNLDLFVRELSSAETDNSVATQLTDSPGRDDYGNPSPDGKHIVFVSTRNDNPETLEEDPDLWVMDSDGGNVRRLTDSLNVRENLPNW